MLPEDVEPYQESLDRLTAAAIHDEVARTTGRNEIWALTQLRWSHAELAAKVTPLEGQAESVGVSALPSAPAQSLEAWKVTLRRFKERWDGRAILLADLAKASLVIEVRNACKEVWRAAKPLAGVIDPHELEY